MQEQAGHRQTLDSSYRKLRDRQDQLPSWLVGGLNRASGRPYLARNVRITVQAQTGGHHLDPLRHPEADFSTQRYERQIQEFLAHVEWWERIMSAIADSEDSSRPRSVAISLRQIRARRRQLDALTHWCEDHAVEDASWHLDVMISKSEEAERLRLQVSMLGLDCRQTAHRLALPFLNFTDTHLLELAARFGAASEHASLAMARQISVHACLLSQETSVRVGRARNLATQMRKLQVEEAEVPVQVPV